MKTEAALLSEIAAASTFREQAALVAELDTLRSSKTASKQAERDIDLANAVVRETLTPVLTHSFHTASTDWLSEAETAPAADVASAMHTEASLWFGKTSAMVKEDHEEFAEQARGYSRRLASQYGERAAEADRAFLDYVAFLHRREAASGLPQIQQLIDGNNQSARTPLPEEHFDTFYDAIDPMNQGVDEAQSSDNAPLLQEILSEGNGEGQGDVPDHHDTAPMTTQNPMGGNGMQVGFNGSTASLQSEGSLIDAPSVAQGYLYNLDDFLAAEAAIKTQAAAAPAPQEPYEVPGLKVERIAVVQREAASMLPQVQQTIDVHDQVAPTPMPMDVMFPLIPYFQGEQNTEQKQATRKQADMFGGQGGSAGTAQPVEMGSANPEADKTHDGSMPGAAGSNSNAMDKALGDRQAMFAQGANWAKSWTPDQPLVSMGSSDFEAGVYAGISENAAHQDDFIQAHAALEDTEYAEVAERIEVHAKFTATLRAEGGTMTDLDTMDASTSPSTDGQTPINGRGEVPPMAGGMDPAAPGGAAPYNAAEPFGHPVAPDPGWTDPKARMAAFQQRVQAGLQTQAVDAKNTPVCRGCGEAFENKAVAHEAHGKKGCGAEDGERGYEMRTEKDAW